MVRASTYQHKKSLDPKDLVDATGRCTLCGFEGVRESMFTIQESSGIELLQCPRCGGASASKMPRTEILDGYYDSYYKQGEPKMTFHKVARLARHILKFIRPGSFSESVRILDFGGGDGALSEGIADLLLSKRNVSQVQVDLVDYESNHLVPKGPIQITCLDDLESCKGQSDLVLASAVLEHIPFAKKVIEKCFGLVAEGGYFYARTPYIAPLVSIFKNLDMTFPGHVHDLGAPFWNRVVQTYGLDAKIVHSGPSPVETSFANHPARTLAAYLLKTPALLEGAFSTTKKPDVLWKWVGGWEILLKF